MSPAKTRILLMGIEPLTGCAALSDPNSRYYYRRPSLAASASALTPSNPVLSTISDGPALKRVLEASFQRCRAEPDLHVDLCWFHLEETTPTESLRAQLRGNLFYDALVIGWGVRGIDVFRGIFEEVVRVIREEAPFSTRVLFSNSNSDHLETVRRVWPVGSGVGEEGI